MAFQCELMDDPVVAADGHTYNRFDIENWFKEHDTSPLTSEPLEHKILTPNIMARKQINAWREQHGLPALSFGRPPDKAPAPLPPRPVPTFLSPPPCARTPRSRCRRSASRAREPSASTALRTPRDAGRTTLGPWTPS